MSIKSFWKEWNRQHLEMKGKVDAAMVEHRQSKVVELKCPKCHGTHIHVDTKGYQIGKSLIGKVFFGNIGLLFGFAGKNKLVYTCLDCEYKFVRK